MKHLLITLVFIISIPNCHSQSNSKDKLGSWFTYAGTHRISDKFSACTLTQLWTYEVADNFNFMLLYGSLSYHISSKITTTLGYGYADINGGFNTNNTHTYENRVFEQLGFKHRVSNVPIDHRFRMEQRFLRKQGGPNTKHRLRYRLGTKIKLNTRLFIRINDEFLATIQDVVLMENRWYGALGIHVSKSCDLQLGYLNRNIKGKNFHRLQAGVFLKTDHRKVR